ncbi:MAG: hypothetical protein ACE5OZ_18705 [Candidatus Heimdallarchaeota archaeon]
MRKLVFVASTETGHPLVDINGHPILIHDQMSRDSLDSLGSFFSILEKFSGDLVPVSLHYTINKKSWWGLYGTTNEPEQFGILAISRREPRGDPYKTTRILSIRLMEFLEWTAVKSLQTGIVKTKASPRECSTFYKELFEAFQADIRAQPSYDEEKEVILSIAQVEDMASYRNTKAFIVSLRQAVDILESEFSPEDKNLLRHFSSFMKPLFVSLSFMDAVFRNTGLSKTEKGKLAALPQSIELVHRKDSQTRYKIRFYYSKVSRKGSIPAWAVLTTTNPLVATASRVASTVNAEHGKCMVSPEELWVRISNLAYQTEFTDFESMVHHSLGTVSMAGIRGIVRFRDLVSIEAMESETEMEISAGIRRIQTDKSLQERIISSLDNQP